MEGIFFWIDIRIGYFLEVDGVSGVRFVLENVIFVFGRYYCDRFGF